MSTIERFHCIQDTSPGPQGVHNRGVPLQTRSLAYIPTHSREHGIIITAMSYYYVWSTYIPLSRLTSVFLSRNTKQIEPYTVVISPIVQHLLFSLAVWESMSFVVCSLTCHSKRGHADSKDGFPAVLFVSKAYTITTTILTDVPFLSGS